MAMDNLPNSDSPRHMPFVNLLILMNLSLPPEANISVPRKMPYNYNGEKQKFDPKVSQGPWQKGSGGSFPRGMLSALTSLTFNCR